MFAEVVVLHAQRATRFLDAQQLSGSLQTLSLNMLSERQARIWQKKAFRKTNKVLDLTASALAYHAKIVAWKWVLHKSHLPGGLFETSATSSL
jgi:hypothetical protein